jgi:hypothetical protein
MTKAEARKAALEARRILLRIRREAEDEQARAAASAASDGFDELLRVTYEGEAVAFACKR